MNRTIKACAVDASGNIGPVVEKLYVIEGTDPYPIVITRGATPNLVTFSIAPTAGVNANTKIAFRSGPFHNYYFDSGTTIDINEVFSSDRIIVFLVQITVTTFTKVEAIGPTWIVSETEIVKESDWPDYPFLVPGSHYTYVPGVVYP